MVKYDFEIASKLNINPEIQTKYENLQPAFGHMGYLEILQECNNKIGNYVNGRSKNFSSMYDYSTGKLIGSLDEIPEDCKLIIVSEYRPPEF